LRGRLRIAPTEGQLKGPGLHRLPKKLDGELVKQAHELGLVKPRPLALVLGANFLNESERLKDDFESFAVPAAEVGSFDDPTLVKLRALLGDEPRSDGR
jgi:hypothetical protein